jgi:hypothetical protein
VGGQLRALVVLPQEKVSPVPTDWVDLGDRPNDTKRGKFFIILEIKL